MEQGLKSFFFSIFLPPPSKTSENVCRTVTLQLFPHICHVIPSRESGSFNNHFAGWFLMILAHYYSNQEIFLWFHQIFCCNEKNPDLVRFFADCEIRIFFCWFQRTISWFGDGSSFRVGFQSQHLISDWLLLIQPWYYIPALCTQMLQMLLVTVSVTYWPTGYTCWVLQHNSSECPENTDGFSEKKLSGKVQSMTATSSNSS